MTGVQFDFVLNNVEIAIANDEVLQQQILRTGVPLQKQLHVYLYYIGHNAYLAEIDDRFALASPAKFAKNIATILCGKLYREWVRWPNESEKTRIKALWQDFTGFKNVIGAVDWTHIQILGNGKYKAGYTSRKCVYAINLTIVCDFELRILYASIGCPGSYHDKRVCKYTPVFKRPGQYFNGHDVLLGDSAYTDGQYLVSPYRMTDRSNRIKATFNHWHARGRVKVENTIGLIKSKNKFHNNIGKISIIRRPRLRNIQKKILFCFS